MKYEEHSRGDGASLTNFSVTFVKRGRGDLVYDSKHLKRDHDDCPKKELLVGFFKKFVLVLLFKTGVLLAVLAVLELTFYGLKLRDSPASAPEC